jgi:beta-lactam-binding protein with PASTA domain
VSFISSSFSAIGRLVALGVLAAAFLLGMSGVVYMSLQGSEVKVPEILGKDLPQSERDLASLGLKIKKRAERVSDEQPGTVIEQLPKPGETVKTGQMILVVTSKGPGANGEHPASLKQGEEDDTEKIEEMISDDKPKKKSNSNTNRKKADTTRDVNAAAASNVSAANAATGESNKKEPAGGANSTDKPNKNTQPSAPVTKPGADKPKPEKKP